MARTGGREGGGGKKRAGEDGSRRNNKYRIAALGLSSQRRHPGGAEKWRESPSEGENAIIACGKKEGEPQQHRPEKLRQSVGGK